jgi:hypothetical protein
MKQLSTKVVKGAPIAFFVLGALASGTTALAFIRLTDQGGAPIRWASQPVRFAIHASGSKDLPQDARDDAAIRLAFETWGSIETSSLRFSEVTLPSIRNGPKRHENDGVNLVFFDEDNSSSFFDAGSGIIAITPVFFDGSGNLIDADIVFNGRDHHFSTDLSPGTYDIQNIATHEIGHFVGLDHTGIYGASLIPFAFQQETRLRSLSSDERAAVESLYPGPGAASGQILGHVNFGQRGCNGAHVVVTDAVSGEPRASAISDPSGDFAIRGLPAGSYRLYVEPLDGPTADENLQRNGIDTNFTTVFFGGVASPATLSLASGATLDLRSQPLRVTPRSDFNITGVSNGQAQVLRGTTINFQLSGTGLSTGLEVEVPGPGVRLSVDDPNHGKLSSQGTFRVTIDPNAPPGLHDIYIYRNSRTEMVALPGGLEVRLPPPTVFGAVPSNGPASGGNQVTITGNGFVKGARVVFGDEVAPAVAFVSETALVATAPGHEVGPVTVVVVNPDGQQGAKSAAYSFTGEPQIASVFPASGPTAGGVPVAIFGSQFGSGARVRFDLALATGVVVSDQGRRIDCVTPVGTLGPADVTVENPDGGTASAPAAYTYIAPRLDSVTPASGSTAGGTVVSLEGDGLSPGMRVDFGAARAASVEFVSQQKIRATTPPGEGTVDVTVVSRDGLSDSLPGAFRYLAGADPIVSAITPDHGPERGGTGVIIFGSNFEIGAKVEIGGAPARDVAVVSPSEIQAKTPPGHVGPADVRVTNPSSLSGALFGGFTYEALAAGSTKTSGAGGGGGGGCAHAPAGNAAAGPGLAPSLLLVLSLVIIRRRVRARRARAAAGCRH